MSSLSKGSKLGHASTLVSFITTFSYTLISTKRGKADYSLTLAAVLGAAISLLFKLIEILLVWLRSVIQSKLKALLNILGRSSLVVLSVLAYLYGKSKMVQIVAIISGGLNFMDAITYSKSKWKVKLKDWDEIISIGASFFTIYCIVLKGLGATYSWLLTLAVGSAVVSFVGKIVGEVQAFAQVSKGKPFDISKAILNFFGRSTQIALAVVLEIGQIEETAELCVYLSTFLNLADASISRVRDVMEEVDMVIERVEVVPEQKMPVQVYGLQKNQE